MTIYMQWMITIKPHSCVEQLTVSDLICWVSYHIRATLSCDMRPHKETRSDTISRSTHSCGFPMIRGSHLWWWCHCPRRLPEHREGGRCVLISPRSSRMPLRGGGGPASDPGLLLEAWRRVRPEMSGWCIITIKGNWNLMFRHSLKKMWHF